MLLVNYNSMIGSAIFHDLGHVHCRTKIISACHVPGTTTDNSCINDGNDDTYVNGASSDLNYKQARLAQSVEHGTLNPRVVGSSPTLGGLF